MRTYRGFAPGNARCTDSSFGQRDTVISPPMKERVATPASVDVVRWAHGGRLGG